MAKLNRHSVRQLIAQDPDYFLTKYKGQKIAYENETAHQMFLDLAVIIDTDNDGLVDERDFDEATDMIRIAKTAKQSNSAELNYKHLPKAVSGVLEQWDADKSGSVGISELVKAGEAQKRMENENRLVKRLLVAALVVIGILMAATFGLSFAAVQMAKDSKPDASGVQALPDGRPVSTGVANKVYKLAEFPALKPEMLSQLEKIDVVHSGKYHHYKITGFEQAPEGDLILYTQRGSQIEITAKGIISVDGAIVKVEDGRRLGWGGSLMTSGSFTMMASSGL